VAADVMEGENKMSVLYLPIFINRFVIISKLIIKKTRERKIEKTRHSGV
jgi:hypothetical protein